MYIITIRFVACRINLDAVTSNSDSRILLGLPGPLLAHFLGGSTQPIRVHPCGSWKEAGDLSVVRVRHGYDFMTRLIIHHIS